MTGPLLRHQPVISPASGPRASGAQAAVALESPPPYQASVAAHRGRLPAAEAEDLARLREVAHDLRSPVNAILLLLEHVLSERHGELNSQQARELQLAYGAALYVSSVAGNLVELRAGHRLLEQAPIPLSLTSILEQVRDIVLPVAEEKRVALHLGLPAVDARRGHPVALSRVLLNLVTNALTFIAEGSVTIGASDVSRERVVLTVSDTGPGLPAAALAALCQPFPPAQGRPGCTFSGTGLGLAICRDLLRTMGSELRVETHAGWGTRFSFELCLPPVSAP